MMIGNASRILAITAALLGLIWPVLALATDDASETACRQQTSTVAIVNCLSGVTAQWNKRLNKAYQAAITASESPARKQALISAERAWLVYRNADCNWYGVQQGTIREVEGQGCLLDMTRSRATELETSMKP